MTVSGLAFHLLLCGLLGVAFAIAVSGLSGRGRVLLLGLLSGLAWYYFCFGYFWRQVNPLVPLYSPDGGLLFAHLVLGALLGCTPGFRRRLDDADAPPEPVMLEPSPPVP
jgi:hypothetical protein